MSVRTEPQRGAPPRAARNSGYKILQLCAVDFTAYHFLLPLARRLRQDHEIHFASSNGPYVSSIREEGFSYHCIPIERSYDAFAHARATVALRRLMAAEKYDMVHTHTPIASLLGRVAASSARVPWKLYTAHGYYFHDRMSALARRAFVSLERIGSAFTDFTFTQSAEDRDAALHLGLAPRDRILHVGNGVDLSRFDPDRLAEVRHTVRRELDISSTDRVVCVVGRLVREKGYLELVEAFASLLDRVPEAVLVAVGGALESDHDDAADEILAAVRSRRLEHRCRFLSFRRDVERVLSAGDVFILPSHREGMPRSLLEAMAMGLAVVVTDIRGSREAVRHGESGLIVPVGDVTAIRDALAMLLQDGVLRARLGAEAKRVARRDFDEQAVIDRQIATINRLLGSRPPRGL